ncbi:MAG TPA: formimidoylglutamate deiminase [Streptosporangiaceae bacterium]|jgi:formiminoglutamate deiminase
MAAPSAGGRPDGPASLRRWHAELAWVPGLGVRRDVLIEAMDGRFTAIEPGSPPGDATAGTVRLRGLTLPGLANAHSHAFHRALRGITQAGPGTFWTWRERMYEVAGRLTPDRYLALARATYAEMALAGITCVGEFHYLHHGPGGVPYADPNAMGHALLQAAAEAGIRITLLDTCYLAGGLPVDDEPQPLQGPQLRFGDGDSGRWAERVERLGPDARGVLAPHARAGAAIHSVRAVPHPQMHEVVAWSHRYGAPLHAHLSEQPAENAACRAAYGSTPAELLSLSGALGPRSTMVHATHLTASDMQLLGGSQTCACFCPATEADLADGIGPARELASAGSPLSVGSDSHAVVDLFAEARGIELTQRLATGKRGQFTAADLATAATVAGHACLGWPDAGEIVPGALADLVTVALDTPRLAGTREGTALESVIFAATAADVRNVVVAGRDVVRDGQHLLVGDVPAALSAAIGAALG